VRFDDALSASPRASAVRALLPARFEVRDWTQEHANYFRAIRIEKTMMALSPRKVMGVFVTQGLVIGWLGVAAGVALGVLVARNVSAIAPFIERAFGFQIMDSDVYYITEIPSDLQWENVAWIGAAALLLTALATVYPALRAAGTAPAEALRYE
jgi:lipoprotein-releasing system permease protein